MKKILSLLLCISLASCLETHDLDAYRDKTTIDPALAGTWEITPRPENPDPSGLDKIDIQIVSSPDGDKGYVIRDQQSAPTPGASLMIGDYSFVILMRGLLIVRYHLDGNSAALYHENVAAIAKFLQAKCPGKNIQRGQDMGSGILTIPKLDDDVVEAIASIPDTEEYWGQPLQYQRTSVSADH